MLTRKTLKTKHFVKSSDFTFNRYHEILKKPKKFTDSLKDSEKLFFAFLIRQIKAKGPYFSMTADRMAYACGMSKSSVKRVIPKFVALGLLAVITLPAGRGSFIMKWVFKISDYFVKDWVKRRARGFFAASILLPVALLFSINLKPLQLEYELRLKEEKKYILRNNTLLLKKDGVGFKKKSNLRSLSESMAMKDKILSEIVKIKRVKFTKRGMIELLKYPPEAITHLNQQLKFASGNIRNLTGWVFSILSRYVKDNNLKLNIDMFKRMIKLSNFNGDEQLLESNELVAEEVKRDNVGQNGMYKVYVHKEREEKPLEEEVRVFEEYLKTPEAKIAKELGILHVPPRVKDYYRQHFSREVE